MKQFRFNSYAIPFLALPLFLLTSGCAPVIYRSTHENIPEMSYFDARKKVTSIKKAGYIETAKIKVDGIDIVYPDDKAGKESIETVYFKSIKNLRVTKAIGSGPRYVVTIYHLPDVGKAQPPSNTYISFYDPGDAISVAEALYALKRHAEGYRSPQDLAADAAFQEEVRKYRQMPVKPALPEEARKYAVQAEFSLEKKNFEDAADRYEDALRVAPWWPEGHFNRALILANIEQYEEAIAEMKKYLLLVPDAKDVRAAQDNIYKWESFRAQRGSK